MIWTIRNIGQRPKPDLPDNIAEHPQFGRLAKELDERITRCLQKSPDARPSADDVVRDCEKLCYSTESRETGAVSNYVASTLGFIDSDDGETVFFHAKNLIGEKPEEGTRVWFTKFDGRPRARAIPVLPFKK